MTKKLFDLTGKTALITGSARGLGNGYARGLADAGAKVVLNDLNAAPLEDAVDSLRADGFDAEGICFDVSKETSVVVAFEDIDARGLAIDILINNAGIQHRQPMVELAAADWQRVIDTNLTSAFLVGREAAKRMIKRGSGGKIINIGSLTSELARATVAPYTTAKGGIKMLTKAMTAEWAEHGIQVNAIGPGYMLTEMTQPLADDPKFDGWVKGRTPARRWGLPQDLIGTAVFLASSASDYVNGQIIYVDGGMISVL
ncbi:MAG: SDR family oxidoreductase [Rhodospirillales bacterium]|nr:SDR family oxidoreductase [Rhodospirillales bacterium]